MAWVLGSPQFESRFGVHNSNPCSEKERLCEITSCLLRDIDLWLMKFVNTKQESNHDHPSDWATLSAVEQIGAVDKEK
jgi:hypothetical protein